MAAFTLREVFHAPVFRLLVALSLLLNLAGLVIAKLFLLETIKVLGDILWLGNGLLLMMYTLFLGCTLFGRDLGEYVVHFFVPAMSREAYFAGRLLGLACGLLLLLSLQAFEGMAALALHRADAPPVPLTHAISMAAPWLLFLLALLWGLAALGILAFVCSWATAQAEMLTFSAAFLVLFAWTPEVLSFLQNPDVASQTPAIVQSLLKALGWIMPAVTPGDLALAIVHAIPLNAGDWLATGATSVGVSLITLVLGFLLLKRRPL
ncbi:MAG: hypothetical protein D6794_12835 [Deltaproteobacteria bacterium]|nr:MAG: hypothetical protein D6794_12835 [Deltaproteobacteria bacterium]